MRDDCDYTSIRKRPQVAKLALVLTALRQSTCKQSDSRNAVPIVFTRGSCNRWPALITPRYPRPPTLFTVNAFNSRHTRNMTQAMPRPILVLAGGSRDRMQDRSQTLVAEKINISLYSDTTGQHTALASELPIYSATNVASGFSARRQMPLLPPQFRVVQA